MSKTIKRAAKLHLLTAREVLNAPDGDLADGGNLMLRVRGATAAWVFRYTAPSGRRREMGLGPAHRGNAQQAGATLMAARDLAHQCREQLRNDIDPIDARDARRDADREAVASRKADKDRAYWTLFRCARDFHARVIEPTKSVKHAADWINSLENHIPASIWRKPIGDITPPELLRALLAVKPHERARRVKGATVPETLRRIRQRLDAIYEDASFFGRCTSNPAAAIRRKLTESFPEDTEDHLRALPYREAATFMHALRQHEGQAARCLELGMLTAARTGELLSAVWAEFDLDAGVWTVPAKRMKTKEEHVVFLPLRAMELLKEQKALKAHDSIVFPSPMKKDKPLSSAAMLTVLNRMGYRDRTTVHGVCRSTFSTWANESGAARPDVIEACLAHSESDAVRRAYNRARFDDERRALLTAWDRYLSTPTAQVVPMPMAA